MLMRPSVTLAYMDPYPENPTPQFQTSAPAGAGADDVGAANATKALVFAILGLVCCGPLGIVAYVMGKRAKTEAEQTGRRLDGTMKAAYIIGLIEVILLAVGVVLGVLWVLAIIASIDDTGTTTY